MFARHIRRNLFSFVNITGINGGIIIFHPCSPTTEDFHKMKSRFKKVRKCLLWLHKIKSDVLSSNIIFGSVRLLSVGCDYFCVFRNNVKREKKV